MDAPRMLCIGLFPMALLAQGSWIQQSVAGPQGRESASLVFDAARGESVLFGGAGISIAYLGDTWKWTGGSWILAATSGPSPRRDHAMAFDSVRGRVVLFGGSDGTVRADTWEWDGSSWLPQVFAIGPQGRGRHAMAFDSVRGRVVMFGGYTASGSPIGDTWEWNGTQWSAPSITVAPAGRHGHGMAFDAASQRVVLFGGANGSPGGLANFLADTWEWDGSAWSMVAASGPSPRSDHAMAFNSTTGRVLSTGGWNGGVQGVDIEWTGSQWDTAPNSGGMGRYGHSMTYDIARGRMVVFGGTPHLNSTVELLPPAGSGTGFGAGCGTPSLSLASDAGSPPTVGATARAAVGNMPTPIAAMMAGWSNTAFGAFTLPVSLAALGMPTCNLLQSAEVFGLSVAPTTPGNGEFLLPIPNVPAVAGLHVYLQAVGYAPGQNPGGFITSNGVDWAIGH